MPYEKVIVIPVSRTSDAGAASGYANGLADRGVIQSWDLAAGSPGLRIDLYPPEAGVVKGDYEGYREKILAGFARYGYEVEKPVAIETIQVPTVEVATNPDPGEPGN